MANPSLATLKAYMNAGLNILIAGPHGVGKTALLSEAANSLGYKVKYYSASTLDPFADLVGIPVPNQVTKTVEYFRPREIDSADVIFMDELNRADPRTINTLLEIIQFRSINGEKLPNLKLVVAAINPVSEEYNTDELDAAVMDRFDVTLTMNPEISGPYFSKRFGPAVGKAAVTAWREYESARSLQAKRSKANPMAYISPRRMEKITAAFVAVSVRQTIADTLPPTVQDASVTGTFFRHLSEAVKPHAPASRTKNEKSREEAIQDAKSIGAAVSPAARRFLMMSIADQRNTKGAGLLANELPSFDSVSRSRVLNALAVALSSQKSPAYIEKQFKEAVNAMSPAQRDLMMSSWPNSKKADMRARFSF